MLLSPSVAAARRLLGLDGNGARVDGVPTRASLADTAAELAVVAQEAPERFRRELTLFWEEVEKEAARIEAHLGR